MTPGRLWSVGVKPLKRKNLELPFCGSQPKCRSSLILGSSALAYDEMARPKDEFLPLFESEPDERKQRLLCRWPARSGRRYPAKPPEAGPCSGFGVYIVSGCRNARRHNKRNSTALAPGWGRFFGQGLVNGNAARAEYDRSAALV
jgi:hypothetical protein